MLNNLIAPHVLQEALLPWSSCAPAEASPRDLVQGDDARLNWAGRSYLPWVGRPQNPGQCTQRSMNWFAATPLHGCAGAGQLPGWLEQRLRCASICRAPLRCAWLRCASIYRAEAEVCQHMPCAPVVATLDSRGWCIFWKAWHPPWMWEGKPAFQAQGFPALLAPYWIRA